MSDRDRIQELLERYVEVDVVSGEKLSLKELCREDPALLETLGRHVESYEKLSATLDMPVAVAESSSEDLPTFEGFRTVERLGKGGGGEVFKLEDLELGRVVAAKVLRADSALGATVADFLSEARALALFADPRIVRILEFRRSQDRPVLLMEFVDGFELDELGPSLEFSQRARLMVEIAEAIHHAHTLGVQHRDLKPANILVDSALMPHILDFGLSQADPRRGHFLGTLSYMAPELFDAERTIDERTDVYALGVVLYELLCGSRPYSGRDEEELMDAIREGESPLPLEIDPSVPEPLQAIALKAMESEPGARYSSAREMALELRRYLDGRPVLARPTNYQSALARRLRPHVEQIWEWLRLKLIYPHEAQHLTSAYRRLEGREDDWIVQSRTLSLSKVALYLGAFLLSLGALLYFEAYRLEAVAGLWEPILALGLPLLALYAAAAQLYRKEQKAVAVAFCVGSIVVLLVFLLILFGELGIWPWDNSGDLEIFADGPTSNRQLQVATLLVAVWAFWLGWWTQTVALASAFTTLAVSFHLALLGDLGLRTWIEDGRWDVLALNVAPLLIVAILAGRFMEKHQHPSFGLPIYLTGAGCYVLVLELLALDGRAFHYLGLSTAPFQPDEVSDPLLLDTVTAMTVNGVLIYGAAWLLGHRGSRLMDAAAQMLYAISPFAILKPLFYLNHVDEYSRRFDWFYLALALAIAFLSHYRQRRSFYYAGLINSAGALWLITSHYEWWNRPAWAVAVVLVSLTVLAAGWGLSLRERAHRSPAMELSD